MTLSRTGLRWLAMVAALSVCVTMLPHAQQMPDPSQMSGVPLPVGDVPTGTITVRVIRGSFANPVASQTVELTGSASPMRAATNEIGRAEFRGLTPGTRVKASATVGGERLESQEFAVPAAGGIRVMLVGADPVSAPSAPPPAPGAAASPPATPREGTVVLGDESRFVFEMGEDGLSVFYVLQIVNSGTSPAWADRTLLFELPGDARGATVLQGSSPQATVAGRQMKIVGPFAPGPTIVQLAYTMPITGPTLAVEQKLPLALSHLAVVAQKVGEMQLASPQIAEQRTMPAQGNLYIAGRGGLVPAGTPLQFNFSGLPHHALWPRNLAIALVVLILAGGVWAAARPGTARTAEAEQRRQLEADRDRLFDELTDLETRNRAQEIDPGKYAEQRRELVTALEGIYGALDDEVAMGRAS